MTAPSVPQEPRSFWIDTSETTAYPAAERTRVAVDVAVLGGGITGVAVAAHLKRAGMTVALVEARRLCHATPATRAKPDKNAQSEAIGGAAHRQHEAAPGAFRR